MAFGNNAGNSIGNSAANLANAVKKADQQNTLSGHDKDSFGADTKPKLVKEDQNKLTSSAQLRLATTDARTLPFTQWVMQLRGPATWIGEKEQRAYYEFGYGSSRVNAFVKSRLIKAVFFSILGIIAGSVAFAVLAKKPIGTAILMGIAAGLLLGVLIWLMGSQRAMAAYRNELYRRQLVFIQFERLLIPYLSEMKDGVSLFSMLKRVARRLPDAGDRQLVQRLMTSIAEGDTTSRPFVDFARRFGGSDSARLFMLSVYQMYAGNYNDAVVKDLGEQSNREMMQQVDAISRRKLKRFNNLTTWLTMAVTLVIIGYLGLMVVNQFQQAFRGIG